MIREKRIGKQSVSAQTQPYAGRPDMLETLKTQTDESIRIYGVRSKVHESASH